MKEERKRHQELDAEIREMEKKISGQHKNMGGVHMSSQHTQKTSKGVRKLENQLQLVSALSSCWWNISEEAMLQTLS